MKHFIFQVDKSAFDFPEDGLPDYIVVDKATFQKATETLEAFFKRIGIEEWGCIPKFNLEKNDLKRYKVLYL